MLCREEQRPTKGQGQSPPPSVCSTGAGMCVSTVVPAHVLDTCAMRSCQNARDENPRATPLVSEPPLTSVQSY